MFTLCRVSDRKQWIQVDFLSPYAITGVTTQGGYNIPEWVTSYKIWYSTDGNIFTPVIDSISNVTKIFPGNTDQSTPKQNIFSKVIARYVRIVPVTWSGAINMRFNLYGCVQPMTVPTTTPLFSGSTTTAPTTTTPTSCMYWTPWVNHKTPDEMGDYESEVELRKVATYCSTEKITAIQCRTADAEHLLSEKSGQNVNCDLNTRTLMCLNVMQTAGQKCRDYEIRVLCDECISTTSPKTTISTPVKTTTTSASPTTTSNGMYK